MLNLTLEVTTVKLYMLNSRAELPEQSNLLPIANPPFQNSVQNQRTKSNPQASLDVILDFPRGPEV